MRIVGALRGERLAHPAQLAQPLGRLEDGRRLHPQRRNPALHASPRTKPERCPRLSVTGFAPIAWSGSACIARRSSSPRLRRSRADRLGLDRAHDDPAEAGDALVDLLARVALLKFRRIVLCPPPPGKNAAPGTNATFSRDGLLQHVAGVDRARAASPTGRGRPAAASSGRQRDGSGNACSSARDHDRPPLPVDLANAVNVPVDEAAAADLVGHHLVERAASAGRCPAWPAPGG